MQTVESQAKVQLGPVIHNKARSQCQSFSVFGNGQAKADISDNMSTDFW